MLCNKIGIADSVSSSQVKVSGSLLISKFNYKADLKVHIPNVWY